MNRWTFKGPSKGGEKWKSYGLVAVGYWLVGLGSSCRPSRVACSSFLRKKYCQPILCLNRSRLERISMSVVSLGLGMCFSPRLMMGWKASKLMFDRLKKNCWGEGGKWKFERAIYSSKLSVVLRLYFSCLYFLFHALRFCFEFLALLLAWPLAFACVFPWSWVESSFS